MKKDDQEKEKEKKRKVGINRGATWKRQHQIISKFFIVGTTFSLSLSGSVFIIIII